MTFELTLTIPQMAVSLNLGYVVLWVLSKFFLLETPFNINLTAKFGVEVIS
jgi:hypothetical protein